MRDSLGRIVRVEETGLEPRTLDYRHDAAGRLDRVTVDGVRQDSVGYDANGNRTHWQGVAVTDTATATTDAQDRLLRHGAATYAHTADGERTMRIVGTDTTRYAYDALGSLVQVVLPGADTVRYRHDGLGRRVERRQAGTPTRRWLYGDAIAPVVELDETDAVVARYVHGTWGHAPDLMLTPTAGHRVVTDHLGSVRMLVDTLTGTVVRHVQRTAWGVATLDTGSVTTSLGYAGGLTDPATGLVRFGARDHDPVTGRWTAKDPIGLAGGTNLYAYAANRPHRLVDPAGLLSSEDLEMKMENGTGGLGSETLEDVIGDPLEAFADGVIPFSDPLADAGAYDIGDRPELCWSKRSGQATGVVLVALNAGRLLGPFPVRTLPPWLRPLQRARDFVRYDPAQHRKPPGLDGKIVKWFERLGRGGRK